MLFKLCQCRVTESSHRSDQSSGYWQLQLDRDLFDTISAIYPEWFRGGGDMTDSGGGVGGGGGGTTGGSRTGSPFRESPPKAIIDTSPILMDQNKESLKVKLLLRRPLDQLVAQGIMPPHGQRKSVERAKTGDILKAKIQQRPPRQELERRHILEADALHADPSLAERQRMLKKARLADQLNDQLSHRPGPLELIQKNILHTEEPIEQAVKTGKIPYKATSEGALKRPQHPQNYINPEEDSQGSSEGDTVSPGPSDVIETAAKSAGIVVSLIQPAEGTVVLTATNNGLNKDNSEFVIADLCRSVPGTLLSQASASSPASLVSSTSTLSPLSSVASPVPSIASQPATPAPIPPPPPPPICKLTHVSSKSDAPGKDKNRKKSKSKSAPKARTIKFHEYKGPPSAQKSSSNSGTSGESSYDLLLKQQTLLLQFQLQLQHKYPQIILPAQKSTSESSNSSSTTVNNNTNNAILNIQQHSPATSTTSESSSTPSRIMGRLEDMKVNDLKAELKRRNMPVSGPKTQLIERLKPFTNQLISSDTIIINPGSVDSSVHSNDQSQDLGSPQELLVKEESSQEFMELGDPMSPAPQTSISEPLASPITSEDLVREQQRQIEVLQRELAASQLKIQALGGGNTRAELQKHLQAKQQQQQAQQLQQPQHHQQQQNLAMQVKQLQALQAKQIRVNEEQQRLQQQQHVAFQNQKNLNGLLLNGNDAKTMGLVLNGTDVALVRQLIQGKGAKLINGHNRTNSLPNNILTSIVEPELKREYIENVKQYPGAKGHVNNEPKPPPLYEEATKQKKSGIKSQVVDDVLDILIKNGELPPSAASYPSTPGSAGTKIQEPIYPTAPQQSVGESQENVQIYEADTADPNALSGIDPNEFLDTIDNLEYMDFSQLMDMGGGVSQQENNNVVSQDSNNYIVPMDTDEWLDALMPNDNNFSGTNGSATTNSLQQEVQDLGTGYDPLLGLSQDDTFDPFNLEEFRSSADLTLSWDRIDYAA